MTDNPPAMTEPIEAMAQSAQDHMEQFHGVSLTASQWDAAMTAAYAALRETLVPVGWVHEHERGESVLSRKPMTRGADELGWTETPLYDLSALKEVVK